jgi:transposase
MVFRSQLTLLTGIKGIAETSAIALMGELLLLPPDLSHREWVKFAGLDPKSFDSGKKHTQENTAIQSR